jgi:hypothetical protein
MILILLLLVKYLTYGEVFHDRKQHNTILSATNILCTESLIWLAKMALETKTEKHLLFTDLKNAYQTVHRAEALSKMLSKLRFSLPTMVNKPICGIIGWKKERGRLYPWKAAPKDALAAASSSTLRVV